ncbi:MAG: FoF1 ATP synthase subunit delta/epsilon [Bacteroidota bacterium]|nr:F0F1 ATP synthase subunit epsilon [Bacteroidota bacterium]
MKLEVITPEANLFAGEAISVSLPGVDGIFQVLNNHAPIISTLKAGEMKVELSEFVNQGSLSEAVKLEGQNILRIEIKGGVAELFNNKLIVLAE